MDIDKNGFVIQCGDSDKQIKKAENFNPDYYILLNYDLDNHYELITYDKNIHKSSFTFPELPYKLKKLIISTCMKYDTGAYSLINDFRNLADEEGIVYKKSRDLLGKNLDKSVSSLYTDDYVILIHNNIINAAPGKARGETLKSSYNINDGNYVKLNGY